MYINSVKLLLVLNIYNIKGFFVAGKIRVSLCLYQSLSLTCNPSHAKYVTPRLTLSISYYIAEACSWRPGSRCYPGACNNTTTDSCQCIEGFTGPDCDTSMSNILNNK